jgi:hypothetical protein
MFLSAFWYESAWYLTTAPLSGRHLAGAAEHCDFRALLCTFDHQVQFRNRERDVKSKRPFCTVNSNLPVNEVLSYIRVLSKSSRRFRAHSGVFSQHALRMLLPKTVVFAGSTIDGHIEARAFMRFYLTSSESLLNGVHNLDAYSFFFPGCWKHGVLKSFPTP